MTDFVRDEWWDICPVTGSHSKPPQKPTFECDLCDGDDRHERDCPEWEPSDNELMNRPGVEGGIGYPLGAPAYDEHDWRL